MLHKEYPKYVFLGQLLAMVKDEDERAALANWKDAPDEEFSYQECNHFQHLEDVPSDLVRKFHKDESDEEIIPGVTPPLVVLPVVPETSLNPAAVRRAEVAAARKAKKEEAAAKKAKAK